jgi:hypothetical protein
LHTLHLSTLLLLGVSPFEVLVLVVCFPTSPSSSKTESVCIFYRVFEFGGFTSSFLKEVFTSSYLVFYLLLLLGFYGLHWIDIFLSFSKSPSLLKSVSGCESYRIFCEAIFCRFRARFEPGIQPEINQKVAELFSCIFGFRSGWTEFWTENRPNKWEMTPTAIFGFPYKRGIFPNGFLGFLVCS